MARTDLATHVPPSARRAAFFAALAFVLYFSLCPSETVDETFSKPVQSYDWLFHTATYVALGSFAVLAFLRRPALSLPVRAGAEEAAVFPESGDREADEPERLRRILLAERLDRRTHLARAGRDSAAAFSNDNLHLAAPSSLILRTISRAFSGVSEP